MDVTNRVSDGEAHARKRALQFSGAVRRKICEVGGERAAEVIDTPIEPCRFEIRDLVAMRYRSHCQEKQGLRYLSPYLGPIADHYRSTWRRRDPALATSPERWNLLFVRAESSRRGSLLVI
jgi:hypothetical protein